ncbi:MAG TPA: MFS transporter [Xanthobacteraceae bacterium]|jgi:predicted MFS family arabinose efflux permease
MTTRDLAACPPAADQGRRRSIAFLNWAHAIDHYVMLILATVVIDLAVVYQRSYAELIALGTPSFIAFGLFSLPAGWLGDRWSRRNMIALFYFGCAGSLLLAGLAPNLLVLTVALTGLGIFAAIYHPVGTAMLIAQARSRGRSLAFNGVCGNLGVAVAAALTAALAGAFGWRGAFLVPALVCVVSGVIYLRLVPDGRHSGEQRPSTPDVLLPPFLAAIIFALFVMIALSAGLVFHIATIAVPKLVDERLGSDFSLIEIGGIATAILMCGAVAQLTIGRLVERFPLHLLFAAVAILQFAGVLWSAYAKGPMLVPALAVAVAAIYAQVTVNDLVIARYTADAWRSRIYAVRYFLTFLVSGAAVSMIALFYVRGGFDLVLGVTARIALGFVVGTVLIAVLVSGIERQRARTMPAE